MSEHEITVEGVVWCNTCRAPIIDGDEYGDRLTPDQINRAVADHVTPQVSEEWKL